MCAVDHPRFLPSIQSTHDVSSLDQINRGLGIAHVSGLYFACQLTSNIGGFKSQDSQASTCFSPRRSKSWLRHPVFEAYRKITRKLLMRHLIGVLKLKLHVNRCSLARATGPFSFASLQKERPGLPVFDITSAANCSREFTPRLNTIRRVPSALRI